MLAFLISIVAGFLTPYAQSTVDSLARKHLAPHIELMAGETRTLTFIAVMLGAGIVIALTSGGSPFWVILGGTIGLFLTRLVAAGKRWNDNRNA